MFYADGGTGALDGRLKLCGVMRPGLALDPVRDTFVLEMRAGDELAHRASIAPGARSGAIGSSVLAALLREEDGTESIELYRQPDGAYKFRVRGRGISMLGPHDGGLELFISMGSYSASGPLPLRPTRPGRLVFP